MTDTAATPATRPEPLHGPRNAPDGRRFPWGPITAVHEVGPYAIVEYRRDMSNAGQVEMYADHGTTHYHPYIYGKDSCHSYGSLDAALVGGITYRVEGPNGRAAGYFMRMIGAES